MGQGNSSTRDPTGQQGPTPDDDQAHVGGPRKASARAHGPTDIPRNNESPVFFGSPMNSPPNRTAERQKLQATVTAPAATSEKQSSPAPRRSSVTPAKKPCVPTVFRWSHGGKQVYITGTFNGWKERIPLSRSREEFATIIDLPVGVHQYKFIVDDEWRYNPDQPTMPDRSGAVNNFVQVDDEEDVFDFEVFAATQVPVSPPGSYSQDLPQLDPATKPPPVLPPHLMQVLLNQELEDENDPTALPVPNHVMLNHLYALSISDGVMVMGVTTRYQEKYVTAVIYRPVFDDA